jgi:L-asparaginase
MVELKDPKMPVTTLLEYDPLIDSSDMGPREWARIASDIEQVP